MADEPKPIRVLLVEDNDVFRQALDLLLELQDGNRGRRRGRRRHRAPSAPAASTGPTSSLMDFRLPGLDGVEATLARRERVPGGRRRLPDGVREPDASSMR